MLSIKWLVLGVVRH